MNLICLLINCNSIDIITKLLNDLFDVRSNRPEINCIYFVIEKFNVLILMFVLILKFIKQKQNS